MIIKAIKAMAPLPRVDAIVSQFTTVLNNLKDAATAHREHSAKLQEEARLLQEEALASENEAAKAGALAENINKLLTTK